MPEQRELVPVGRYKNKMEEKIVTKTPKETINFAKEFAKTLKNGDIVLLSGDLGAGKTVFAKGFVEGRGVDVEVVSPTFTIMNEYGSGEVFHFDLYRLSSVDEFEATGAYEELFGDGVSIVEWPEIVGFDYFPETAYVINIKKIDENVREITIKRNNI